ncbi:pantoate--beta-alanine ligase [Synoicihabitans lomoniglobus]|uniref:Pantothenate synthetase n=1 Tax=Synoicihabitans lomoniglobus TaxID=2909285 RepID=A0AAE9ZTS9_9BACT|nr:pantoate--beta-alanine ligase [Opitutaceae bacterium LMO-M01]WED64141.1 pantoate--beta-alanine ligase [Opitutaceae bacterium LMO-M01]
MQTLDSVSAMQALAGELRAAGRTVALVPTMGALHEGHLDLIRLAATRADVVVVSIFVNPTQFGPNEDYTRYPRDLEGDLAKCADAGAHHAFIPTKDALYPPGYSTYVNEESVAKPLEGVSRPAHFRGVTTIVTKLFNIVQPTCAIFGQKDAQQVAVIRKVVTDLHLPVEIVTAPTTRDDDGVALSSRNAYLTPLQRTAAAAIPQTLETVKSMVAKGERRAERLTAEATHLLSQFRQIRIIYIAVVDPLTMQTQREVVPGNSLLAVAVWVEETRLIDNALL